MLREKSIECERIEILLGQSERKVKDLERQLLKDKENRHLVDTSKQQLKEYSELEQSNRHLIQENVILR